jgi:hypothetical protein
MKDIFQVYQKLPGFPPMFENKNPNMLSLQKLPLTTDKKEQACQALMMKS